MSPEDHFKHVAPLRWLVAEKLHKGVSFEQRVAAMRARRWRDRAPVPAADVGEPFNEPLTEIIDPTQHEQTS